MEKHAKHSTRNYLLPLAIRSKKEGNGKVVVARPDSVKEGYTMLQQVIEICDMAVENDLYETMTTKTGTWKTGTLFRFLDGDGETFGGMFEIIDALIAKGYAFYTWGLVGMGGNFRNNLKRDNLSAKYALSAVGKNNRGVVKFSESLGKGTLAGAHKVLRSEEALRNKRTIVFETEEGEDARVEYFNGLNIWKPFGIGQDDDFLITKKRIKEQMASMPLTLESEENKNYPASEAVLKLKQELLIKYAPSKGLA